MRALVLVSMIAATAVPQFAAASDGKISVQTVPHFQTIAPAAAAQNGGLAINGGYCRQTRYAARPTIVRIVKTDAAGGEMAVATARVLGATGNRSQGCGFYSARLAGALAAGETIQVRPVL